MTSIEPPTEGVNSPPIEHRKDETKPGEFVRHVGPVYTCICGRHVVAGYKCGGA